MMPRPTTTSAAATTITKNTAVWPSMSANRGQSHEREVDGVEHELDAHEHHERVAADHQPRRADGEQRRRRARGSRWWWAPLAASSAGFTSHLLWRFSLRVSSTVPATATMSSTDVNSNANTWSPNRLRASRRMLVVAAGGELDPLAGGRIDGHADGVARPDDGER